MSNATKTIEVKAIVIALVDMGESLETTIDYILSKYDGITEEYITEKYNLYSSEKNTSK
jgi:hypothetical protein